MQYVIKVLDVNFIFSMFAVLQLKTKATAPCTEAKFKEYWGFTKSNKDVVINCLLEIEDYYRPFMIGISYGKLVYGRTELLCNIIDRADYQEIASRPKLVAAINEALTALFKELGIEETRPDFDGKLNEKFGEPVATDTHEFLPGEGDKGFDPKSFQPNMGQVPGEDTPF